MEKMEFNNFGEFVSFCKTTDTNDWSKQDIESFNKKVHSLIKKYAFFKENYDKLRKNATIGSIRESLHKKRKKISLEKKRDNYRKTNSKVFAYSPREH